MPVVIAFNAAELRKPLWLLNFLFQTVMCSLAAVMLSVGKTFTAMIVIVLCILKPRIKRPRKSATC